MLQTDQARTRLQGVCQAITSLKDAMGLESLENEYKELTAEMTAPDFWNDLEHAQKVNRQLKGIENKITKLKGLADTAEEVGIMIDLAEMEEDLSELPQIESSLDDIENMTQEMRLAALLTGQYDANNAIVSLHAGAGGTEAQDWTDMLQRMYLRWSERKGYSVKVLDYLAGDEAGVKSITFMVEGDNAYGYLKAEKGVHRLVRISPFDANARRHTSFSSVDVMPEIEDEGEMQIDSEDLRIDTYRASGAGGQHINKTDSAVRITHIPTGIVVACQNERSQIQNKETAMKMLRSRLIEVQEQQRLEQLAEIKGEMKKIEWGSQIRSYVFQPYTMVKDHRTGAETGAIDSVMNGDIDLFINEYLKKI